MGWLVWWFGGCSFFFKKGINPTTPSACTMIESNEMLCDYEEQQR
jgi:hypothetical protein